jgi:hypothetical protein
MQGYLLVILPKTGTFLGATSESGSRKPLDLKRAFCYFHQKMMAIFYTLSMARFMAERFSP